MILMPMTKEDFEYAMKITRGTGHHNFTDEDISDGYDFLMKNARDCGQNFLFIEDELGDGLEKIIYVMGYMIRIKAAKNGV